MAFSRSCVAESFSTTPRAPNCRASTIWLFSAAAVSRITRTGVALAGWLRSRSASRPGCFGMERSSNKISGFSCLTSFTASAPSEASPRTFMSASASSNRRRPSRKIGWSSAITRRTGCDFLKFIRQFPASRHRDFQARPLSGIRFYRELAANQAHPLFYYQRPFAQIFHLLLAIATLERKSFAVVLDRQIPPAVICAQAHKGMLGSTMFSHIDQALLHHAQQFAANALWHFKILQVGDEARADSGLALKAFDRIVQHAEQAILVHFDRLHLLHQFAQLQHLLAQQSLDAHQFPTDGLARLALPPHYINLHLHGNQRLHRAIVQFPREARALGRSRSPPHAMQQVNVIDRRTHLPHQAEQEAQFLLLLAPPHRIEKKYSPSPFAAKKKRDRHQRIESLRLAQLRQRYQVLDRQLVAVLIQRQSGPAIAVNRGMTNVAGKIIQISLGVAGCRLQPAEFGRSVGLGHVQLADEHAMAVRLLRCNHQPRRPIHREDRVKDLLDGSRQAGLHADPRQEPHDHCLLRTQMLLLFGQISQQQPHYDQIHREHEKALRLELRHIDPQTCELAPGQRSARPQMDMEKHEALHPQQHHLARSGAHGFPKSPTIRSRSQHENEEKEKRSARPFGKY